MQYSVIWMRSEKDIHGTPFNKLGRAVSHARENFPFEHRNSGVDRVEVRDGDGVLLFHHPRTVRDAHA